jgi:hypothetical protein
VWVADAVKSVYVGQYQKCFQMANCNSDGRGWWCQMKREGGGGVKYVCERDSARSALKTCSSYNTGSIVEREQEGEGVLWYNSKFGTSD